MPILFNGLGFVALQEPPNGDSPEDDPECVHEIDPRIQEAWGEVNPRGTQRAPTLDVTA
jgi:hypothetical protein